MNYPLVLHMGSHMIGRSFDDGFEILWYLSWLSSALFEQHVNPLYTPHIFYPKGWYLAAGATPAWYWMALTPLARLVGPVLTYNLTQLIALIVAAFGAYLLTFQVTKSRIGGLIAGLIYVTVPVVTVHQGGHLNMLISVQWLPYAYLAFYRVAEAEKRSRYMWATIGGVTLALTILGHWYFLFISTLPLLGLLLFRLKRQLLPGYVWAGFVCLLFIAPFAALTQHARQEMFPEGATFPLANVDASSVSLNKLFVPNPNHGLWGFWSREHFPVRGEVDAISLGYTAMVLAFVALIAGPRRKTAPLLALTLTSLLLAMGTSLHWRGEHVLVNESPLMSSLRAWLLPGLAFPAGQTGVPLPGALLYKYLPFYNAVRALARFTIPTALGVAVLAGIGYRQVALKGRQARWLGMVLLMLVVIEGWLVPYLAFTDVSMNERPQLVSWLKEQPADTVLIEYPWFSSNLAVYSQAAHGLSVVNGYTSFVPRHIQDTVDELGLWPNENALPVLREWGVDYVVVNGSDDRKFQQTILAPMNAFDGLCQVKTFDESYMGYSHTYVFALNEMGQPCRRE